MNIISPPVSSQAIAYYVGEQATLRGASVSLFNLLVPLPSIDLSVIHPIESTVVRATLEANGVSVPSYLTIGQRVSLGAQ